MDTLSHIKLIVGLGNHDRKYSNTYHNAGFLAVEYLAGRKTHTIKFINAKAFQYFRQGMIVLVKPKGYMNESGRATADALDHFGIKPHEMLVIHDDTDITIGKEKLSFARGSAGHRGVQAEVRLRRFAQR